VRLCAGLASRENRGYVPQRSRRGDAGGLGGTPTAAGCHPAAVTTIAGASTREKEHKPDRPSDRCRKSIGQTCSRSALRPSRCRPDCRNTRYSAQVPETKKRGLQELMPRRPFQPVDGLLVVSPHRPSRSPHRRATALGFYPRVGLLARVHRLRQLFKALSQSQIALPQYIVSGRRCLFPQAGGFSPIIFSIAARLHAHALH
jgi:hypothetical protein